MDLKIVYFSNKSLATAESLVSAWNISNAFPFFYKRRHSMNYADRPCYIM